MYAGNVDFMNWAEAKLRDLRAKYSSKIRSTTPSTLGNVEIEMEERNISSGVVCSFQEGSVSELNHVTSSTAPFCSPHSVGEIRQTSST